METTPLQETSKKQRPGDIQELPQGKIIESQTLFGAAREIGIRDEGQIYRFKNHPARETDMSLLK